MSALELLQLLGGTLARGAVILLATGLGARLLRRRSAAGRYVVWGAAFAGLLLLPALTLALPSLEPPRLTPDERLSSHGTMLSSAPADARNDPRPSAAAAEPPRRSSLTSSRPTCTRRRGSLVEAGGPGTPGRRAGCIASGWRGFSDSGSGATRSSSSRGRQPLVRSTGIEYRHRSSVYVIVVRNEEAVDGNAVEIQVDGKVSPEWGHPPGGRRGAA